MSSSPNNSFMRLYLKWGLAGIILAVLIFIMSTISPEFGYELNKLTKPVIPLVALMMAAGTLYLFLIRRFKDIPFTKGLIIWIIVAGLAMRLSMFNSTPMLEDDHYRYLWDGAVLATGFNPYKYPPAEFIHGEAYNFTDPLHRLADESNNIIERINYPWLRTIYPPVPEGAFAFAHIIRPWSLNSWRFILLAVDLVTLYLLLIILNRLGLSPMGIVVYWWNPLLIKEIYNSGHMDVLIFPFILSALFLSFRSRPVLASGALGLAVGTKFWPVLLIPVILRPFLRDPKRLIPALFVFGCVSLAVFLPFYATGLDPGSGFRAYATSWEMNDTLFMFVLWTVKLCIDVLGLDPLYVDPSARIVVLCILLAWTLWITRVDDHSPAETSRRFLLVTAALYLLSPTQYPWYFLWMLPFLAILPRISLLILTPLLSLYYLRFYLGPRGMIAIHDNGIVWVEFVPVWCLLVWEWYRRRQSKVTVEENN